MVVSRVKLGVGVNIWMSYRFRTWNEMGGMMGI